MFEHGMKQTLALLFAEDPGAANYLARLPAAASEFDLDITCELVVCGPAAGYLGGQGVPARRMHANEKPENLITEIQPDVVVVGTSQNLQSPGLALIQAARERQIPTIGCVDAAMNAHLRFSGTTGNPMAFAPDIVLVVDDNCRDELIQLGFLGQQIIVTGHPYYEHVAARANSLSGGDREALRECMFGQASRGASVICFLAEPSDATGLVRDRSYTLSGSGRYEGRTEIVIEEFLSAVHRMEQRPFLILRLHPKNSTADFAELETQFDRVSFHEDPIACICASDLVIGMTTSLLVEAVVAGRPCMSILPRQFERNWLPPFALPSIAIATTADEIEKGLGDWSCGTLPSTCRDLLSKPLPSIRALQAVSASCR